MHSVYALIAATFYRSISNVCDSVGENVLDLHIYMNGKGHITLKFSKKKFLLIWQISSLL